MSGSGLSRVVKTVSRKRVGNALALAGLAMLLYASGNYLELLPGSTVVLPEPVALARPADPGFTISPVKTITAVPSETRAAVRVADPRIVAGRSGLRRVPAPAERHAELRAESQHTPSTLYAILPTAADAEERRVAARLPPPGIPTRLRIAELGIDTDVVQAGIGRDRTGQPVWDTVPYVAAYYTPTALAGARGNTVIAGHVVTLYEGNVFRELYRVQYGDLVEVTTATGLFRYEVAEVRLVLPDAVEVMEPTTEPRLTLITCGGRFDRRTQSFDQRLVVIGRLVQS